MDNTIRAWGGYTLKLNLDENENDIAWMIKYEDHGDEYVIVHTKDGHTYEYGLWINIDHNEWMLSCDNCFIRKPNLYFKDDVRSRVSNEIYFKICDFQDRMTYRPIIYESSAFAQYKFDRFVEFMKETYEKGVFYREWDHKNTILRYLEKNNILTEENLDAIEKIHWDTKVDGYDGVVGKTDITGDERAYFDADKPLLVIKNGKECTKYKTRHESNDEWGYETRSISFKQFR